MNIVEKQVLLKKTFYIAKDGAEFDNILDCRRHEGDLAVSDAKRRFEFTYLDKSGDKFSAIYHDGLKDAFAEDLSIIINQNWDVAHTNMSGDYDPNTILTTFKKELGAQLVDGHKYSFEGYLSYTDEDHEDDFYMDITDMTDPDMTESAQLNGPIQECREVIFENQTTRDFIEIAKRQVKDFGSAAVRSVLETLIGEICGK